MHFLHAIRKTHQYICPGGSITQESVGIINQFLLTVISRFIHSSLALLDHASKKTLSDKVFMDTLGFMVREGVRGSVHKLIRHYPKSTLLFPSCTCKRIVRTLLPAGVMLTKKYNMYLTLLLQYLCCEWVDLAYVQSHKSSSRRILPNHLVVAIQSDRELYTLYRSLNMVILPSQREPIGRVRLHVSIPIHADALDLVEKFSRNL
jgi:hypothetical protein